MCNTPRDTAHTSVRVLPSGWKLSASLNGVTQSMPERTWSQSSVDNIVVVSGDGKNVGNNGELIPNDSKSSSFKVPTGNAQVTSI